MKLCFTWGHNKNYWYKIPTVWSRRKTNSQIKGNPIIYVNKLSILVLNSYSIIFKVTTLSNYVYAYTSKGFIQVKNGVL